MMAGMDPDTRIGGARTRFPETHRSAIRRARSDEAGERVQAWQAIVEAYWKPAYKYARIRWNLSNEDAKDLIQGFFARAMEKQFFSAYEPAKATFRTYLRTCLDGFAANQAKAAGRVKRGGGVQLESLDFDSADEELRRAGPSGDSIDEFFHREWLRNLFALAVARLREECAAAGTDARFRVFEQYDLCDGEHRPSYAKLAAEHRISIATVTNHLAAARRRFRQMVVEQLHQITATEREFRSEARAVLGIEV